MRSCDLGVVSRWVALARAAAVAAAAALMITACSDSHGGGRGPGRSTETGNPPVIDVALVALVVSSDEVHVVGEPGAVTPGGGEVVVETLSSGAVQRGPVQDDGSFDVMVTGTLYDTYLLHAKGSGDAGVSEAIYLNRGGAMVGVQDGGALSCDERQQQIVDELTQAEASASRACDSNSDCFFWPPLLACPHWYCEGAVVSEAGRAELDLAVAAIEARLCAPFAQAGCPNGPPGCTARAPVACVAGQCTNCRTGDCPETTCAQCETPQVSWTERFATTMMPTFSITDCTTFTRQPADGASCTRELPCIGPPNQSVGGWSAAQLQNALGHPDVTAALAAQATFGAIAPGGYTFAIRVGDDEIALNTECMQAGPDCIDAPYGVQVLRDMLDQIAQQQACATMPTPSTACEQPFDPGEGPGEIVVYAFHPQTGTCVQQVYTGAGGNENRFDDVESCRASCPTTATEGGCPPNRMFVTDACHECSNGPGGCGVLASACAKLCTTAADCAGEGAFVTCGLRGVCEVGPCD